MLGGNARKIYDLPSRWGGPAGVVADYFAAVTIRDAQMLRQLFAPDAFLDAQGSVHDGVDAIARFYEEGAFQFGDLLPHPGPLISREDDLVVEIDLHIAGIDSSVVDTFQIADGHIRSLRIEGLTDRLRSRLATGPVAVPPQPI